MDKTCYTKTIESLEQQLDDLKEEGHNIFVHAERAVSLCAKAYFDLQKRIIQQDFKSEEDEINFFKKIKPRVCAKITFYRKLATIESLRPQSTQKQIEYLQKEISKLYVFFEDQRDFIEYYRSGQTIYDDKYFKRNIEELVLKNRNYEYLIDPDFTTVYDTILSKVLAYEHLEKYMGNEINKLERLNSLTNNAPKNDFTGKLTDLAELLYGIKETGVVNNGNISISELAELFGSIFNLPSGSIFNAFRSVYSRKTKSLHFIDRMREAVIRKINEKFK